MRLQTHRIVIAVTFKSLELTDPVNHTAAYRSPFVLATGQTLHVLAVAMTDAFFWQQVVAIRIWRVIGEGSGVAGIPVEHEVLVRDGLEHGCGFRAGCRIARHLVLEQQDDAALLAGFRGLAQLIVDGRAIWLLIVEPPEVEA